MVKGPMYGLSDKEKGVTRCFTPNCVIKTELVGKVVYEIRHAAAMKELFNEELFKVTVCCW